MISLPPRLGLVGVRGPPGLRPWRPTPPGLRLQAYARPRPSSEKGEARRLLAR